MESLHSLISVLVTADIMRRQVFFQGQNIIMCKIMQLTWISQRCV